MRSTNRLAMGRQIRDLYRMHIIIILTGYICHMIIKKMNLAVRLFIVCFIVLLRFETLSLGSG